MYRFKYTYSNGVEEFSRIFTLEEIEQGCQFDEISDSPLLKDYKIVGRKLSTTQKDINGIEIFDGDTCECWGGESWEGKWQYYDIYEVKWQGVGFDMVKDNCGYCWSMNNAIEYIEVIGYSNTFTEASSLSSKIKDNKLKARNKAIEDAISYIANKIRECVKGGNNNCFIWKSIAFGVWRYDIEEVVYSLLKDRGYILNNTPDAGGFNINIPN